MIQLVAEMRDHPENFYNYRRMFEDEFNTLLQKVHPIIAKQTVVREPIPAGLRLSLTLRYLASGDCMKSLAYNYRVGDSTVSQIILETCEAIWQVLQKEVLPIPKAEDWEKIARDFEKKWNFPNCIGAIDGKHVIVKCFPNTGSTCDNYKGSFSIVLLAVCDANNRFTFVSIGSAGRESDGGIFENTEFSKKMDNGELDLPPPKELRGKPGVRFPPVFVGDAAFPLKKHLMKGTDLPPEATIFNYRKSRGRRTIENSYGIMSNRHQVFRKPIQASYPTAVAIVKAAVCLHNLHIDTEGKLPQAQRRYLMPQYIDVEDSEGNLTEGQWRQEPQPAGLQQMPRTRQRNATEESKAIRDAFRDHFMAEGHLPWQWNKLPAFMRDQYRTAALYHFS